MKDQSMDNLEPICLEPICLEEVNLEEIPLWAHPGMKFEPDNHVLIGDLYDIGY